MTSFIFFLITVLAFLKPPKVHAYIDPGTGSYFFQILLGIILGSLFSIKIFWHKIKKILQRLFTKKDDQQKSENQKLVS